MGLIVQLIVHCAVVMFVASLPQHCDRWWQGLCVVHIPVPVRDLCDAWCEQPQGNGLIGRVCCKDIKTPQFSCPTVTRRPGECTVPQYHEGHFAGLMNFTAVSKDPTADCGSVIGPNTPKCYPGEWCCPEACGGVNVCKHPKTVQVAQVAQPVPYHLHEAIPFVQPVPHHLYGVIPFAHPGPYHLH